MINLKDRLSRLTYREACKLLGPEGEKLIGLGGKHDVDIENQVTWEDGLLKINFGEAIVTFLLTPEMPRSLRFKCSECTTACEHLGAAFSLVLEEKLTLGLSAPPPERKPVESLSDAALIKQAVEERLERSRTEKIQLKPLNKNELWSDYTVTNPASGKSYRVALRGWEGVIPTALARIFGKIPSGPASTSSMPWQRPESDSLQRQGIHPTRSKTLRSISGTAKRRNCGCWSQRALMEG